MVRLLHTADVHLTPDAEERTEGLDAVLTRADSEGVDLVTVGGDLFDSDVAAERLREPLRDLFADREYPILTIPGNHDADAFRANLFFGEAFVAATESPFGHFVVGDDLARVTSLPYRTRVTDDLLVALRDREPFDGPEFLVLHCSLEAPVRGGVGDEGEQRYFPITKAELAGLDFEYYLAGHYHTRHHAELSNGGTFVYPGSPASIARTETGRRTTVLVDTDATQDVQFRSLETFHYDSLEVRVTPGAEEDVIDEVRSTVDAWAARRVEPAITVDGFTERDETAFNDALVEASGDVPVENRTRTVEHVLSHPLFQRFQSALEQRDELHAVDERDDYDVAAFQDDAREAALDVFAELSAEGKLS